MKLLERGYERLKFFPAEQAGGSPYLKSLSSPLAAAKFCPTGGVSLEKAPDYLKLPNVLCVGGSWIADAKAIASEDWAGIEDARGRRLPTRQVADRTGEPRCSAECFF
jgi:2-dehydro-3-deoxyphosphogluconate aldolase/(4S)-4-hydroxy-2-oxoglutarate aldolase